MSSYLAFMARILRKTEKRQEESALVFLNIATTYLLHLLACHRAAILDLCDGLNCLLATGGTNGFLSDPKTCHVYNHLNSSLGSVGAHSGFIAS